MNDAYFKWCMEKLENMTTEELRKSLEEFGFQVTPIEPEDKESQIG